MLYFTNIDSFPIDLANQISFQDLAVKETLFKQNDKMAALFVVETGRIKLIRYTDEGKANTLEIVRKGEIFAKNFTFSHTYSCTAIADTASPVIVYPKQPLLSAFRENPDLAEDLMTMLVRKIQSLKFRLELLNIRSAQKRVLLYLRYLASFTEVTTINLDRPLKDIAQDINIVHYARNYVTNFVAAGAKRSDYS